METVDSLLLGGAVVTMDGEYNIYKPGGVAIHGNSIVAVGPEHTIAQGYTGVESLDCSECAVIPGLINAHTHASMTLLRGLADDLRLDVWLVGYMMPVEREFVHPDFCWLGTQLACAEMILSGVTCFADMYYFEETVADAAAQAGMRAVCAESILKFPTPDAASYDEALNLTQDFVTRWKGHELVIPAVGPHAAYTSTPEMLQECAKLALAHNVPIHIHLAETADEVAEQRAEYGMPVVPWVKKQGLLEPHVIAAHCVHLDEGELHTLLHHNVGVVHCPTSNLKLASGFAPVARMLELGIPVGIGTDGSASNNDLDMIEEMRLAALLAKGVSGDPTVLSARQALEMATVMGARALNLHAITGSIETNKRADLAIIDLRGVHLTPQYDDNPSNIYSLLVYGAKNADVRHVMCNGRWLMLDRQIATVDVDYTRSQASRVAQKVSSFLVSREESVLSKLLAIGGVAQEKTFEVQVKVHLTPDDLARVEDVLSQGVLAIVRSSHRRQYDTYLAVDDRENSRIRYREDEILSEETGQVASVEYRLTLTSQTRERVYENSVILSRSRYDAPASHSLRFYREYFKPTRIVEIAKERRRFHIRFGGTALVVNVDLITHPPTDAYFLEIKSRTWSSQDAERKAALIGSLLRVLNLTGAEFVQEEYPDLVLHHSSLA